MDARPAGSATAPARSPLLDLPGAVPAEGIDAGLAWHYGDPVGEQRGAERAAALFDRSTRDVIVVPGADRLSWLHTITSQALTDLADGAVTAALILSPQGHVEHHFGVTHVGGTVYLDTDPGRGGPLLGYLESMRFWSDVQPALTELAILHISGPTARLVAEAADIELPAIGSAAQRAGGFVRRTGAGIEIAVPRADLGPLAVRLIAAGARPAGSWAAQALQIAARQPRLGVDTDDRTIPNELPWLTTAVHLDKGCYRGQETVARVHNLGRPPRRLVLLHLDGSADSLPEPGDDLLTAQGRSVGRVGSVAHHHEYGPIALAMVKRTVQPDTPLLAGGVDAAIDPDDATTDDGPPVSAIDRRSLPNLRRP